MNTEHLTQQEIEIEVREAFKTAPYYITTIAIDDDGSMWGYHKETMEFIIDEWVWVGDDDEVPVKLGMIYTDIPAADLKFTN